MANLERRAKRREDAGSTPPPAPAARDERAPDFERAVRCVACGHALARLADRIAADGASSQAFVNPSALEFAIVRYRDARGCVGWGERSTYWTWFPGHAWQVALCGRCGAQVGWWFYGADSRFVGLIVDRVVED